MILSEVRLDNLKDKIFSYIESQNEIIKCSVKEEVVEDISMLPQGFYHH